jgi:hypothetical protein
MNQYVPFYTVFDSAIQEYLIAYLGGETSQAKTSLLAAADWAASKRDRRTPARFPGGIHWGF